MQRHAGLLTAIAMVLWSSHITPARAGDWQTVLSWPTFSSRSCDLPCDIACDAPCGHISYRPIFGDGCRLGCRLAGLHARLHETCRAWWFGVRSGHPFAFWPACRHTCGTCCSDSIEANLPTRVDWTGWKEPTIRPMRPTPAAPQAIPRVEKDRREKSNEPASDRKTSSDRRA